jgi:hypothetical protein
MFCEKITEGLPISVNTEIQVQSQTTSPAGADTQGERIFYTEFQ